jgi:hypothetical protein
MYGWDGREADGQVMVIEGYLMAAVCELIDPSHTLL